MSEWWVIIITLLLFVAICVWVILGVRRDNRR